MDINKRNLKFSINENKELEKIVKENGTIMKIPAKKTFMLPGEDFEYLYFIQEGTTRHYMVDINGGEKILYVLNQGWFFGEAALVLNYKETTLYSKTETDTILYLIDKEKAQILLDRNKVFRQAIMESFAFKTMILRYEVENIVFNPSIDRIKMFLCLNVVPESIDDSPWIDVDSKYTHYEVGVLVGCTRVTVSKMLNKLAKESFIRLVNNQIQINKKMYYDYISED